MGLPTWSSGGCPGPRRGCVMRVRESSPALPRTPRPPLPSGLWQMTCSPINSRSFSNIFIILSALKFDLSVTREAPAWMSDPFLGEPGRQEISLHPLRCTGAGGWAEHWPPSEALLHRPLFPEKKSLVRQPSNTAIPQRLKIGSIISVRNQKILHVLISI